MSLSAPRWCHAIDNNDLGRASRGDRARYCALIGMQIAGTEAFNIFQAPSHDRADRDLNSGVHRKLAWKGLREAAQDRDL